MSSRPQSVNRYSLVKRVPMIAGMVLLIIPIAMIVFPDPFRALPPAAESGLFLGSILLSVILSVYARRETSLMVTEDGIVRLGWIGGITLIPWKEIQQAEIDLTEKASTYRFTTIHGKVYRFSGGLALRGLAALVNRHLVPRLSDQQARLELDLNRTVPLPVSLTYNSSGINRAGERISWIQVRGMDQNGYLIIE